MSKIVKFKFKFPLQNSLFPKCQVVTENAPFHTAFSANILNLTLNSRKSCKSTSSLNTLHTDESPQFYSAFSSTTNSVIRRCCQKSQVFPSFFAEDGQYSCAFFFSARALRHATCFQRKWGIIKMFEYLSEFEQDCQHCLLHCIWYLLMIYEWVNVAKNKVK
jgi:hypothetical protein